MTDLEKLEEVLKHPKIDLVGIDTTGEYFTFIWRDGGYTAGETLAEALRSVREELGLGDKDE
jgi:hypothetical protein